MLNKLLVHENLLKMFLLMKIISEVSQIRYLNVLSFYGLEAWNSEVNNMFWNDLFLYCLCWIQLCLQILYQVRKYFFWNKNFFQCTNESKIFVNYIFLRMIFANNSTKNIISRALQTQNNQRRHDRFFKVCIIIQTLDV